MKSLQNKIFNVSHETKLEVNLVINEQKFNSSNDKRTVVLNENSFIWNSVLRLQVIQIIKSRVSFVTFATINC